jgi:hypothetical protein
MFAPARIGAVSGREIPTGHLATLGSRNRDFDQSFSLAPYGDLPGGRADTDLGRPSMRMRTLKFKGANARVSGQLLPPTGRHTSSAVLGRGGRVLPWTS